MGGIVRKDSRKVRHLTGSVPSSRKENEKARRLNRKRERAEVRGPRRKAGLLLAGTKTDRRRENINGDSTQRGHGKGE